MIAIAEVVKIGFQQVEVIVGSGGSIGAEITARPVCFTIIAVNIHVYFYTDNHFFPLADVP